jgi:2-oxoglutarate ferredoxin oxidoreductase subunit beta
MKKAIATKGFAFIEAVSQCPTAFGRTVGLKTAPDILQWFKGNSVTVEEAEKMAEKDLEGKIVVGEFVYREFPTVTETLYETVKEAKKGAKKN